jgi:copper transporter 1
MQTLEMMMNDTMNMDMMRMYFHFSSNVPHLLFRTWTVQTDAELVGAIVFSFALGVLYEGFKTAKDIITKRAHKFVPPPRHYTLSECEGDLHIFIPHRRVKLWMMRVLLSVLRTVEIGMAYLLMLLAMTYNGWLFLSVCFGAGAGFFVFLPLRPSSTSDDHCG